jgi:hypothetical protein
MSDQGPRSAIEIAMERLRQKDEREGIAVRPRTAEQKAAIAEIRSFYDAKLAQADVMHSSALGGSFDPAERETLEQAHQRERARLIAERDAKIEKAREDDAAK